MPHTAAQGLAPMNTKSSSTDSTIATSLSKRLLISLFSIVLAMHVAGCSSSGSSDEESAGGEETFAEESSGDFEDGEVAEGDEGMDEGTEVAEGEEGAEAGEDGSSEVAEGDDLESENLDGELADSDEAGMDDGGLDEGGGTDIAATDDDELSLDDEEGLPDDVAGGDVMSEPAAPIEEPATPPTDAPVFAEESTPPVSDPIADPVMEEPVAPRAYLPLLKVKSAAFDSGGTNLNRVYVGRPGDTVKSVSEKLYGDSGRQKDLKKWNSFLSRGVKVGDKIYYASPTNPTDTSMLTYYEDVSIPAQNYVSRDGDNIREVSKTLLGHNDSWKEIWSTNPDVESKGDIPAGLNLRYWPADVAAPAPIMAQQPDPMTAPPVDPMAGQAGGFDPLAGGQQPGGMDPLAQQQPPADPLAQPGGFDPLAQNQPPADPLAQPTPASDPLAMGTTEPPPPPPMDPPPAPPADPATDPGMQASNNQPIPGEASSAEADQMMTMGLAGIVLLAAGAVFFLMKRNRSRKIDLTQTTQVG